jgi:predicted molibdopterin-dependent oxidoreductase YjgC
MLVDPADTVVLLPAVTRYEQEGGATETSTERFIYFSPEIPGHQIGEARSEWRIFMEVAERTHPERTHLIHFAGGQEIRREIALAVPFYSGIEDLAEAGDAVQWGGRLLCEGGTFLTSDGRAHFTAVEPPDREVPPGAFAVSTRRGRQFNSMVWAWKDPLTGAARDNIFISRADACALGLADGDSLLLRSPAGEYRGRAKIAAIRPRNLQVHWPEGGTLLQRGVCDPDSGIPDYNAVVEAVPLPMEPRT